MLVYHLIFIHNAVGQPQSIIQDVYNAKMHPQPPVVDVLCWVNIFLAYAQWTNGVSFCVFVCHRRFSLAFGECLGLIDENASSLDCLCVYRRPTRHFSGAATDKPNAFHAVNVLSWCLTYLCPMWVNLVTRDSSLAYVY